MAENIAELINTTNRELNESKKALQDLANEIGATSEIVQPALEKLIKSLRSARMTTVNEIREMIGALKEIREFFMDPKHPAELERLERFVNVCKALQSLKQDGTLDALAETIIRLGLNS